MQHPAMQSSKALELTLHHRFTYPTIHRKRENFHSQIMGNPVGVEAAQYHAAA
jgi:hypothetical protein